MVMRQVSRNELVDRRRITMSYTTEYKLYNEFETLKFNTEKEACEFLGVKQSTVSKCFEKGCKCKGYKIERLGTTRHGESETKLCNVWQSMHERCECKSHTSYKNYGGRGIYVCDDWKEYLKFKEWALSHGYENGLSIDRIDNDGSYCPENCRFVTTKQQANNRRTNIFFELNGVVHALAEWSDITGIKYNTLYDRIKKGWSFEDAINKPVKKISVRSVNKE